MGIDLARDWPAYVLLGAVAFFFIYVIIKSNMTGRQKKEADKVDKK